jgi:FtsZ-interacting cell division protein ZipA
MSELGGILIIVGIVAAAAVLGFAGHFAVHRISRRRSDIFRRRPYRRGRIGRIR